MNYRALSLTAFPLSIVALLSLERLSTYLLGLSPSSAALWRSSLELRALFRDMSNNFDLLTGHSLSLQALVLGGCAVILCLVTQLRRWAAFAFLTNHLALLIVAVATLLAVNFKVASFGFTETAGSTTWLAADYSLTWLQLTMLTTGALSCLWCHYLFVTQARKDQTRLRALLSELQR